VVGLTTFCVALAAVAVATSALSYAGIHALAQQGGIQARYARGYPLLIDALLVIVLAAVLALRGAGLPSRVLSWLTLLVLLIVAAGAEALHATGRRLPRDAAAITVAVLPWLLALVTFVLLLAILRHTRLRQLSITAGRPSQPSPSDKPLPVRTPQPWDSASIVPGISSRLVSTAAAGGAAGRSAAGTETSIPGGGPGQPAGPSPPDDGGPSPPDDGGPSPGAIAGPAGSTPADINAQEGGDDVRGGGPVGSPTPPAG